MFKFHLLWLAWSTNWAEGEEFFIEILFLNLRLLLCLLTNIKSSLCFILYMLFQWCEYTFGWDKIFQFRKVQSWFKSFCITKLTWHSLTLFSFSPILKHSLHSHITTWHSGHLPTPNLITLIFLLINEPILEIDIRILGGMGEVRTESNTFLRWNQTSC